MSEVIAWNDASYNVVVDGEDLWGQFGVAFMNGSAAPSTEAERDAYAKSVADDVKSHYPDAAVTIFKSTQGSKYDSNFYVAGS